MSDVKDSPILDAGAAPLKTKENRVRISLLAEHQKFGRKADYEAGKQASLFGGMEPEEREGLPAPSRDVEVVGLDLDTAELYALFALQKIFNRSQYQGNLFGSSGTTEAISFDGYNHPAGHVGQVPYFRFTRAEFLEAYGVPKRLSARGKQEYGGRESERAVAALIGLFGRRFTIDYSFRYKNGTREEIDLLRVAETLIEPFGRLWEGLTEEEFAAIKEGKATKAVEEKLTSFVVRPSVILMFIKDYFALKPGDFHAQVRRALSRIDAATGEKSYSSKYIVLVAEWVWLQGVMKRLARQPLQVSRTLESLAYHLRMTALIDRREWRRIAGIVEQGLEVAREMGYLEQYFIPAGKLTRETVIEIHLNGDKFPSLKDEREMVEGSVG